MSLKACIQLGLVGEGGLVVGGVLGVWFCAKRRLTASLDRVVTNLPATKTRQFHNHSVGLIRGVVDLHYGPKQGRQIFQKS